MTTGVDWRGLCECSENRQFGAHGDAGEMLTGNAVRRVQLGGNLLDIFSGIFLSTHMYGGSRIASGVTGPCAC